MTSRGGDERTGGAGNGAQPSPRELSALTSEWPLEARDSWAETAAVLEYDAKMERSRAEKAAEHQVRDRWSRGLL